jgi:2-polyprenyl-3-methyl-5-hydroxy-6-metoxy-1,4-benzoquinol methylase
MVTHLSDPPGTPPERAMPGMADVHTLSQHVVRYGWALPYVAGRHALDLGCGSGYGAEILSWGARRVEGFDLWRPEGDEVPAWPGVAALHWGHDLSADPLPPANVGVMFEVLEHLAAPEAALRNAFAAVDTLLVSFPNPRWHGSHHNRFHLNDWPLERVHRELDAAARSTHVAATVQAYSQRSADGAAIEPGATNDDDFWLFVVRAAGRHG